MLIDTVTFVIIGLTHGKFDQTPSTPLPKFYFVAMLLGLFFASFEFVANLLLLLPRQHSSQVCFSIV